MFVASSISRSLNPQNRQFGRVSKPPTSLALNVAMIWGPEFQVPLDLAKAAFQALQLFIYPHFPDFSKLLPSLFSSPPWLSSMWPLPRLLQHALPEVMAVGTFMVWYFAVFVPGWTVGSGGQGCPQISILSLLRFCLGPVFMDHGSGSKGGLIIKLDTGESVFQPDFHSSGFRLGQNAPWK